MPTMLYLAQLSHLTCDLARSETAADAYFW